MKRSNFIATLAAALLLAVPVFAQHGRGGAMGNMGSMGMGAGSEHSGTHGSPNTDNGGGSKSADQLLQQNDHLNTALTNALGKNGISIPGGNLQTACANFRNLGQCIAAIHVSNNLKIPFACLSWDVTGKQPTQLNTSACTAPSGKMSLGKSIQTLDPQVNANSEAGKASRQANQDIKGSQKS